MHGDPRNRLDRTPRFLAPLLIAAMVPAGCGNDQSGDFVPPAKEAAQRQKDMYNFMKEQGKVKAAPKTASGVR